MLYLRTIRKEPGFATIAEDPVEQNKHRMCFLYGIQVMLLLDVETDCR